MIQAKRGHAEGPVAPVRASIAQRCAPEVVLQQLRPRCARQEVWIRQDRSSATPIICTSDHFVTSKSSDISFSKLERIYTYPRTRVYIGFNFGSGLRRRRRRSITAGRGILIDRVDRYSRGVSARLRYRGRRT